MTIHNYKYRAVNKEGRYYRGVVAAANEANLYDQLRSAGLELVDCKKVKEASSFGLSLGRLKAKVKTRDLIAMFMQLEQMVGAGVPLLDALSDARDTSDNPRMRDILSDVLREVSEGTALSAAFARFPDVFPNLYIAMMTAGENTGDMVYAFQQLIKYLKWYDELQVKVKKATRYPIILLSVILLVMIVMMGHVVPQIVEFISKMDQELPWYTVALIDTSNFFRDYWLFVGVAPIALFAVYKALRKGVPGFSLAADRVWLKMPLFGDIIRKINIARYCQTFGVMFSGGIDILNCLRYAQGTVSNVALHAALNRVEQLVQTGKPLSAAFNETGEFPSLVVRMIRIGEESGNLKPVLDQVTDFYSRDVDEAVGGFVTMIEPTLTAIMGLMITWIAAGVFGPIYSSFENLDF